MSKADSNWYTQNSIWIAQRDAYTIKDNAKQRIREEARAEGAKQKAEEAAIELLKEKVPVETIAKCEKLPLETICCDFPLQKRGFCYNKGKHKSLF